MTPEKIANQLRQDASAYSEGFADGYRLAKEQTVNAVPVEFISDYVNHKASPFGEIVINDMMKEWLNSKYGLGHNTNEVKGEDDGN